MSCIPFSENKNLFSENKFLSNLYKFINKRNRIVYHSFMALDGMNEKTNVTFSI